LHSEKILFFLLCDRDMSVFVNDSVAFKGAAFVMRP
jgi:hypothetical protein